LKSHPRHHRTRSEAPLRRLPRRLRWPFAVQNEHRAGNLYLLPAKIVLITGCSTGIGRATAERLARSGFDVYATARRPESLEGLTQIGCQTLALDVTDDSSMAGALDTIDRERGGVDVLVNNAGIGDYGSVEETPIEALRNQLETNVVGLTRLTQFVLPTMRTRGWGRIVNVGSISGKVTFPATGYYSASKYAVEAISDALRFEVKPFGVAVSLVEPGPIKTHFDQSGLDRLGQVSDASPYRGFNEVRPRRSSARTRARWVDSRGRRSMSLA